MRVLIKNYVCYNFIFNVNLSLIFVTYQLILLYKYIVGKFY